MDKKPQGPNFSTKDKLSKDTDIELPQFDLIFQSGILKLALDNDYFCSQLSRYLGEDKDLEEYQVFDSSEFHYLFQLIFDSMTKYKTRPSVATIRQSILEFADDEREPYFKALELILKADTHDTKYYTDYLSAFIQQVKMSKGLKKVKKVFKENPIQAPDLMQKVIDQIRRIHFEKEDVLHIRDIFDMVKKDNGVTNKIPTGITRLDEDMRGGFPRETLVTILAASNAGKSIFCTSLGCSALRANFKVLHINLEGTRDEVVYRYISNLADIPFWKIEEQKLDKDELERVHRAIAEFDKNLKIRNMLNFGTTIEDLGAYCREAYKEFKFDMIIVDYGQLLKTREKYDNRFDGQADVYRGLDVLSKEFNCVVVTPAQSNREGIRKQNDYKNGGKFGKPSNDEVLPVLRSADLADCIEIARVSAVILTLNRTQDEEKRGWVRVFLEKQRRGNKAMTYGIKANYANSNLTVNDYYDANAVFHQLSDKDKEDKKDNAEVQISTFVEDQDKDDAFTKVIKIGGDDA
jgi:replicative DNA helicase